MMVVEFYTLIAMTCLYGAIISMTATNKTLPNMTNVGKRVSISPTNKIKLVLSSLLSSYVVQIIGLTLLFAYTIFALNVDYGTHLGYIVLLSLIGSLTGLSLGLFVATNFKSSENSKMGIILTISMTGVFFAGMMGVTLKYIIDKNIPLLNKINPANMITDGFYSLYYYDTFNRYFFDVMSLLLLSIILVILSYNSLRRQQYDSI
jgi:ABC-2 type transport system permease protein